MKIYLFRHGETDWNKNGSIQGQTDIPLNSTGIKQAQELAERLYDENIPIHKIYTSPQKRAKETALIVADKLKLDCIEKEDLKEICFGLWEGLTWTQVKQDYSDIYEEWYVNRRYKATPEGESYHDLLVRVVGELKEIINENRNDVALIAHSAVIMTLQSWLHDTPFEEMVKRYKTKNTAGIIIDSDNIMSKEI